MNTLIKAKLVVVSHAGIKKINRAVYRELMSSFGEIRIVVPASLTLSSGSIIYAEPADPEGPAVDKLDLTGRNPRTYFYPALRNYLGSHKPDVVLLENDPVSRLGFQVSSWCKANTSLLICQTYENLSRRFRETWRLQGWKQAGINIGLQMMNSIMARRTDALLVVNRDSESIFKKYRYPSVTMIPLGYDNQLFFPDERIKDEWRAKLKVPEGVVLLAYFGRLVKQKGVHLLVEALSELKEFKWMLLMDHVHDSENRYASEIVQSIRTAGFEDRVIYFEANHFEIASFMKATDISISPSVTTTSFKEQYGRAVQEAMACGCVCLVSNSGHLKDLVGCTDVVFEENNVQQIRDRLIEFITDESRREKIRNMLISRASNCLTVGAQADILRRLIEKLIAKSLYE